MSEHINHIYKTRELEEESTVRNFRIVQTEGKRKVSRNVAHYNLDMIISIGYRVNTFRGTEFRIWANKVLKSYLLNGYAIRNQFEQIEKKIEQHDNILSEHDKKFELLIKTHLTPVEGIFYDGQIYDAWKFASDIIKSAKTSIVLIDNYVDESVLTLLSKRSRGVTATIYTTSDSKQFKLDLKKFNDQYDSIEVKVFDKSHDRFLIIDQTIVYHIGASLKDLGKKWFAFSKIKLDADDILIRLN